MKKVTLKQIAERTKTSTTTVYNALNSSAAVDTDLKTNIIKTAEILGYFKYGKSENPDDCDIAVVLPSNPLYFWAEAKKGITEAAYYMNCSVKMFIFTNLDNETDFIYCLERAKKSCPKIYIIVPVDTEESKKVMKNLGKPVIFFNEYADIGPAGFVGPDAYEDGRQMALLSSAFLRKHPRVLIINTQTDPYMAKRRKQGFCDFLPDNVSVVGEIRIKDDRLSPAKLAGIIEKQYSGRFDCIFIAQGMILVVCIALNKLNTAFPCIGCEKPKINKIYLKYADLQCDLVQSIRQHGAESVRYAERILNGLDKTNRSIVIPSEIFLKEG